MKKVMGFLKKNDWIVAIAIILVIAGGLTYLNGLQNTVQEGEFRSTIKIESVGECDLILKNDSTAANALETCAKEKKIEVAYKEFDFGRMVNKIAEKEADKANFWALYYNGEMAVEGADALKLKEGDVTEWKYEALKW